MRKYEIQRKVVLYTIVWADSQEEAVERSEAIPLSAWNSSPEPNGQMVLLLDDPQIGTIPLTPHWWNEIAASGQPRVSVLRAPFDPGPL
jgi:hypothetical protein